MNRIVENITYVRHRIEKAALATHRDPHTIKLLAVSKTQPAENIRQAFTAGLQAFGENYLQEALDKMQLLDDLIIEWHFIGPAQSNKTKQIAEQFTWVHSLDRIKIAERLNSQRPASLAPLNVCIQVNLNNESSKSGISPREVKALAKAILPLKRLKLRGLMAIPAPTQDILLQHKNFRALKEILLELHTLNSKIDTLSMGMSEDLEAAIAEGASIVRIGTAIFGARHIG